MVFKLLWEILNFSKQPLACLYPGKLFRPNLTSNKNVLTFVGDHSTGAIYDHPASINFECSTHLCVESPAWCCSTPYESGLKTHHPCFLGFWFEYFCTGPRPYFLLRYDLPSMVRNVPFMVRRSRIAVAVVASKTLFHCDGTRLVVMMASRFTKMLI